MASLMAHARLVAAAAQVAQEDGLQLSDDADASITLPIQGGQSLDVPVLFGERKPQNPAELER